MLKDEPRAQGNINFFIGRQGVSHHCREGLGSPHAAASEINLGVSQLCCVSDMTQPRLSLAKGCFCLLTLDALVA
jgi:hypothetical protein